MDDIDALEMKVNQIGKNSNSNINEDSDSDLDEMNLVEIENSRNRNNGAILEDKFDAKENEIEEEYNELKNKKNKQWKNKKDKNSNNVNEEAGLEIMSGTLNDNGNIKNDDETLL